MSSPALPPLPEPHWPIEALSDIARAAAVLLSASRVWMMLRDRHGALSPRIAFATDAQGAVHAAEPRDMPVIIARAIRPLAGADSAPSPIANTDLHATPEVARLLGPDADVIRAFAAAPLLDNGKVIGALVVTSAQPGNFSDRRRLMLTTFADQAVAAIQMTTSVERDAAQARVLDALLSASQALTSTLDSDAVFRAIIESIQQVITCDSALIYRYNERAAQLRVIASIGEGTERLKGSMIAVSDSESRVAWVARHKRAFMGVVDPTDPADRLGEHTDALSGGSAVSLLCIPLISKGTLRGIASLARSFGFTAREVSAMQRLSPIAAAALENVELFHQTQAGRQQLEALFASASDGFALIDDSLTYIQVNPAFARYLAAEPAALLGQQCCKTLSGASDHTLTPGSCLLCHGEPDCLLRQVMQNGVTRDHLECIFPPAPPERAPNSVSDLTAHPSEGPAPLTRTIDFSLTPMFGPERRPRLLLVGRDVSGPREVERFRAEQIQLVSHEMGSPLHAVVGNIEFFIRAYGQQLTPEPLQYLNTAKATALSLSTLVNDLDLIARKDAGQLQIKPPRPMDLAAEAREAALEMNVIAQQKGVQLYYDPAPNLPLALADPPRVRQVARNLIINAIKFTPSGGWVRVSFAADAQWVTLRVADTGVGIPREARDLIWRRFYRAQQPGSEETPGRGLGLAIVRIITDAYRGLHEMQDNPIGQGSVFIVSFPRADRSPRR